MDLEDKGMYDKYVTSFYWAIMTMCVEIDADSWGWHKLLHTHDNLIHDAGRQ